MTETTQPTAQPREAAALRRLGVACAVPWPGARLILWSDAQAVGINVLLPATAIAEANRELRATDNAWAALLLNDNVYPLDLTPASALASSRHGGGLAVAHASSEAVATNATIVTAHPDAYDPLLPIAPI